MNHERRLISGLVAGALLLYLWTLAPSVLWGDDAFYQRSAYEGILPRDGGGHWLWFVLARAVVQLPFAEAAYKANLVSAVAAAATLLLLYQTSRALDLAPLPSVIAAAALAVAHTFWMHAVRAEVYTVFTALLVLELLLAFSWTPKRFWPLPVALGLFGLTLLGHQMAVLLLPALGWLVFRRRRWLSSRRLIISTAALLGGLMAATHVLHLQIQASDLAGSLILYFTHSGRDFGSAMFDYRFEKLPRDIVFWLGFLVFQFPSPALAAGLAALAGYRRWMLEPRWQALAVLYATDVVFAFSYRVNDVYVFYLPSYIAFALFIGLGWEMLSSTWRKALPQWARRGLIASVVALPPASYFVLAGALSALGINPLGIRELPGRDPNQYFLWPGKGGYWGAHAYGQTLLESLPSNSVLVADYTPYQALIYMQRVEAVRPDVRITPFDLAAELPEVVAGLPATSAVFLADDDQRYYGWAELDGYRLEPSGTAFRLVPLR